MKSLMMLLCAALVSVSSPALAGNYMVSGLMRLKSDEPKVTLRLTQALVSAETSEEAVKAFTSSVEVHFEEYLLIDTLVTPAPAEPSAKPIPVRTSKGVNWRI